MKYIIAILATALIILSFALWYQNRQMENFKKDLDVNSEIKNHIWGIENEVKELRGSLANITKDTVFKSEIQKITNNFTHVYKEIDTSNSLDPVIDGLLAGHRQTKVERNY